MRGTRDVPAKNAAPADAELRAERRDLFSPVVSETISETSADAAVHASPSANGALLPGEEFSRWDRCLELLVADFLNRRHELVRLNKARKNQIEEFLRLHSGLNTSIEEAVQARIGGPEQEALQLFAHQACVFHLLQIVLLKRWVDRGHLAPDTLKLNGQTTNWLITSFLRRNTFRGMMGRHDWSFLKQNLFSWFSPTKETWERLRLLIEAENLSDQAADFPVLLLQTLGSRSRLALLGFNPTLIDSSALWKLVLEQRAFDQRLDSYRDLDIGSERYGPVLVSGLKNGESLNALRGLSPTKELHGAWAFTDSEFERYLSEMFILWDCAAEIPRINIHPRALLKELSRDVTKAATLFTDGSKMPYQAQVAACFHEAGGKELDDATFLLDQLREGGLLLVASDQFWPTDPADGCERMREAALRKASVRLIIDLRQLTGLSGERLPKGVFLLEKCSNKELRDSNRPQILRARGHLHREQVGSFWQAILEHVRQQSTPGEVSVRTLSSLGDGVRLEAMAAAASQQELRASPWITLSDPAFYEASGRLRRNPSKAYTFGTILRWKPGMKAPSDRAVLLQEKAKTLAACQPEAALAVPDDLHQYLFLPEASVVEHSDFFVAQVYSAPVQLWYRLEQEQNAGKGVKQLERQAEQRLKLMPLLRLFEAGSLQPVVSGSFAVFSIADAKAQLRAIFRGSPLTATERSKVHQIILGLEHSIRENLSVCAEFTKHLYPQLEIHRCAIPSQLPEVNPGLAVDIFRHLDRSPLTQHHSVHITKLRPAHDFKITNVSYEGHPLSPQGELKVFSGMDAILKLNGPALLLRAAHEEIQRRVGRPWRETAERILLPTDFMLVQTQLKEVIRSIESQLQTTKEFIAILDQVFCCLFGLSPNFDNEAVRLAMRRHLSPEDSRIDVKFQREREFAIVRPADSEAARGILH
ncbi:MAG: hypothetical protein EOP11_06485 [Proteobacteria bacterium]|nr:MAG: hypothetical protein EOP11_06485 [Pseudomonadota bacterium]